MDRSRWPEGWWCSHWRAPCGSFRQGWRLQWSPYRSLSSTGYSLSNPQQCPQPHQCRSRQPESKAHSGCILLKCWTANTELENIIHFTVMILWWSYFDFETRTLNNNNKKYKDVWEDCNTGYHITSWTESSVDAPRKLPVTSWGFRYGLWSCQAECWSSNKLTFLVRILAMFLDNLLCGHPGQSAVNGSHCAESQSCHLSDGQGEKTMYSRQEGKWYWQRGRYPAYPPLTPSTPSLHCEKRWYWQRRKVPYPPTPNSYPLSSLCYPEHTVNVESCTHYK